MSSPVRERIASEINDNEVVLYMKGSPVFPQCGFSAAVVQILSHLGVKFKGIDVDPEGYAGAAQVCRPRPGGHHAAQRQRLL